MCNWPEGEDLWRTMSECFNYSFGNKTTEVLHCFEVFINRPSNLLARAQTWSSCKHHNTINIRCLFGKLLNSESSSFPNIGEDEFLSESCGILKKLLPWNVVLAGRDFTIVEGMMLQQAQLAIPAFTKGKGQLYIVDIEKSRGIANVRIHLESVIGLLHRKCWILSGILPIDFYCPTLMAQRKRQHR